MAPWLTSSLILGHIASILEFGNLPILSRCFGSFSLKTTIPHPPFPSSTLQAQVLPLVPLLARPLALGRCSPCRSDPERLLRIHMDYLPVKNGNYSVLSYLSLKNEHPWPRAKYACEKPGLSYFAMGKWSQNLKRLCKHIRHTSKIVHLLCIYDAYAIFVWVCQEMRGMSLKMLCQHHEEMMINHGKSGRPGRPCFQTHLCEYGSGESGVNNICQTSN